MPTIAKELLEKKNYSTMQNFIGDFLAVVKRKKNSEGRNFG